MTPVPVPVVVSRARSPRRWPRVGPTGDPSTGGGWINVEVDDLDLVADLDVGAAHDPAVEGHRPVELAVDLAQDVEVDLDKALHDAVKDV